METLTIKCIECGWTYTLDGVTEDNQDAKAQLLELKLANEHTCPTA
jgi:hypothetical protein